MQEALKGEAPDDFTPPKDAKFAMVRGIREAFRPGTEPRVITTSTAMGPGPAGPQPYDRVWQNGVTGAPNAAAAVAPPPPKKQAEDVSGLY
jgi:penicillin-binding protein 1A